MVWKWLPWKYVVRRLARRHGLLDPIKLLGRLDRLAQPSEVRAPFELIRAGVQFHGRGLTNTRVIQNNLDWEWPYWVRRQFDPTDESFLPRGFAISHVNLTHRNWTAVGLPDCNALPIVDPRGMLTPYFDGWSIAAAVLRRDGRLLFPGRLKTARQHLEMPEDGLWLSTECRHDGMRLRTRAWVEAEEDAPVCRMECRAETDRPGWLVVSLRPCNPEGVSFVHRVEFDSDRRAWSVEGEECVRFARDPDRHAVSTYGEGDVFLNLLERPAGARIECEVGLASAAAMFRTDREEGTEVEVSVPLSGDEESKPILPRGEVGTWPDALAGTCRMEVPDARFQFLYDAALRTLVLHSPSRAYPGPYTYKRFWFRDAAMMVNAMLCAGMARRAERVLNTFSNEQRIDGYFHSQDGEWDANGEALWAYGRFCELTGCPPRHEWRRPVLRGARWIGRKRTDPDGDEPHAGLLPAGFSAEHLGNNDYYYWDDFWAVAGLRAAAAMCERWEEHEAAATFREEADDLLAAVERSLQRSGTRRANGALPASPYRRMDAGAVGSIAVSYPLKLWPGDDERVLNTIDWLRENCFLRAAFFHEVIHSGINAYLTLHIAQAMLRAGDAGVAGPVARVAELASATGQWPEAVHPRTGGGCMGDGQHAWAAAEWAMMMRNMFVREEGGRLILGSGLPPAWLGAERLTFGPAPTSYGPVRVRIRRRAGGSEVWWAGQWRDQPPRIETRLPGRSPVGAEASEESLMIPEAT